MSWLRKALVHLALSRSDEALVKASGGAPRVVRGMTLDPRMQFLEAQARLRATPWEEMTVARLREQTEMGAELCGGAGVGGGGVLKHHVSGRSHSVPARLYLPTVRDNSAVMMVYYHFGGGVVGSLESCHRLCALIASEATESPRNNMHAPPVGGGLRKAEHEYLYQGTQHRAKFDIRPRQSAQ